MHTLSSCQPELVSSSFLEFSQILHPYNLLGRYVVIFWPPVDLN